ncbi:MAG TPA: hypothetical protein ENK97_03160 [Campylobacteraceae bacterium]|nr:hypothetical protein [Campylobacteraceae bacterium]
MKVTVKCASPLLQESLERFLAGYLYDIDLSDILISDRDVISEKVLFIIGKDIEVPFTREMLLESLERFYATNPRLVHIQNTRETLESMIEKLNRKHQEKITRLIKSYHGR